MADKPIKGVGSIDADQFKFSLDGLATYEQFERLLKLTKAYTTKGMSPTQILELNKSLEDLTQNTEKQSDEVKKSTKQEKKKAETTKSAQDALQDLSSIAGVTRSSFAAIGAQVGSFGISVASLVGAVMAMSTDTAQGLQMGIGGQLADFAIAAKTAGIGTGAFTTALKETGGAFAMLGVNASDGSKQFGALVSNVRTATASVGNLGLSNDELAKFTAHQLKVAIQQGFKGRAAAQLVERNSKVFAESIYEMSEATGKTVTELAGAALKLGGDPLVASYIASSKQFGAQISESAKQFAINIRGVFGEMGEVLAADALKSALSGLPFAITNSGKSMLIASSSLYSEFERQAQIVRQGGKLGEADAKRMRDIALREVEARGDQIRTMSMLEGPAGESARQILKLSEEARTYNDQANVQKRKEAETSKKFVEATNKLTARLQEVAIPILESINSIDFAEFTNVITDAVTALKDFISVFSWIGKKITEFDLGGSIGKVAGTIAALTLLTGGLKVVASLFKLVASPLTMLLNIFRKGAGGVPRPGGLPDPLSSSIPMDVPDGKPKSSTGRGNKPGIGIGSGMEKITESLGKTIKSFADGIGSAIGSIATGIGNAIGGILEGLATGISAFAKPLFLAGAAKLSVGIVLIGGAVAGATWMLGKALPTFAEGIKAFGDIDGDNLINVAKGIGAVGLALAVMGAGMAVGSITSLGTGILGLFGAKGPLEKIKELVPISDQISAIGTGFKNFGDGLMVMANALAKIDTAKLETIKGQLIDLNRNAPGVVSARPTSATGPNATVDIMRTQASAVDQNNLRRSETDGLLRQNNKLLEAVADNSGAQIGISSRTASDTAETARYTRQQVLNA